MQWSLKVFLRLTLAVFALSLGAIVFYTGQYAWSTLIEARGQGLLRDARMFAAECGDVTGAPLASCISRAASFTDARVSLLAPDGHVLASAEVPQQKVADPSPFPIDSYVAAEDSRGHMTCSAAMRTPHGNLLGITVGVNDLAEQSAKVQRILLAWGAAAFIFLFALTRFFQRYFVGRIAVLQSYIDGLTHHEVGAELRTGRDEFAPLAQSLRAVTPQIGEVVARADVESGQREAILSSMVEGVLAVDRHMHVIFCNKVFAGVLGTRASRTEGVRITDLSRDPALLEILTSAMVTGGRVQKRIQMPAAESRAFEIIAGPLGGMAPSGALAVLHDITSLERLERVRKDFVANVSHELRTPLASIRGYAETLLDGALTDEKYNRQFVEVILTQATRLSNIVGDLLIISEMESGHAPVRPKAIPVRKSIDTALRAVQPSADLHEVHVRVDKGDDVMALADELRLDQVLINLLDNAVKFNRQGGDVFISAQSCGDANAKITIRDTGIGIPSEDLPRIFERFYRVDKARSRAAGGTGLGLSIVRHAVEQMGGSVAVESTFGSGSTFVITLPSA